MAVGLRSLAVAAALVLILDLVGGATSFAQVTTDGTAGPRARLAGPEFAIGAELGTKAGRNLFHSFEKFSLANGERATFSGPKQIQNVISRVTGGARSDIDGTLASTIPGADLYFMNPAGVVFGPNARLDLLGSFHVSTADELRFADGTRFSARDPSASSFTVAAPEAFGFVRAAPAPILVARSMLGVPVGEALSLIGGDVVVVGGPGLSEGIIGGDGDNRIVVVALGPGGAYRLADGRISGSDFSDILLWGLAAVGTLNGGSVRIHADRIIMVDSDILNVQLSSAEPDEASILVTGRRLEMSGGSQIVGDALCLAGLPCRIGQAGGITVRVDELLMLDAETEIISRGMNGARAGSVTLQVSQQLLLRRGTISTDSTVAGGGEIRLLVGDLAVLRDGALSTSVAGGADPTAGNITLDAKILIIDGSRIGANAPVGFGGQVRIEADNVLVPGGDFQALVDRGDISATGGDPSRAGTVVVSAPEVDLAGELVVPDAALLDAAALMRGRCAARRDIGASSFTRAAAPACRRARTRRSRARTRASMRAATRRARPGPRRPAGLLRHPLPGWRAWRRPARHGTRRMPRAAIRALILLAVPMPALAEVATDGTAGPRVRLTGPELAIGADLGTRAGPNLFHSFETFSLDVGERATFSGPDAIRNVISRVTGGNRSDIDGTLRSTIPGADFFLINPAGVVFGPNASLDVQGSFHVSTADELRFTDGAAFSATNPTASSFTVAAPEAFGFLGAHDPAPILVDQSALAVPAGEALALVGGDIGITGGPAGFIFAGAGQITLAAVGGAGEARLGDGAIAAVRQADISLTDRALVETAGDGGGTIQIRGDNIVVDDHSLLSARNIGALDAVGGIDVDAGRIRVEGGSALTTDVLGSGRGGNLRVGAAELALVQGGVLRSDALPGSTGNTGSVEVTSGALEILAGGVISSTTFSAGDAGSVTIEADRALIRGGTPASVTGVISDSVGPGSFGNAGIVQITAGELAVLEGGQIRSDTFGSGAAGRVAIEAGRLLIQRGASELDTSISSDANRGSSGDAGIVQIAAGELAVLEGGQIRSDTFSSGDAGRVAIEAGRLLIQRGASDLTGISSDANRGSSGDAGIVQITAGELEILAGGTIGSATFAEGDAGRVTIEADHLLIRGGGSGLFTGVSNSAEAGSSGDAGSVRVVAGELEILAGGAIESSTFSVGDAGIVTVEAGALQILAGGVIGSATFSEGSAGRVTVEADRLLIQRGSGPFTGITSRAEIGSSGHAGAVRVVAGELKILAGGIIDSVTFGQGSAGGVTVEADRLLIRRGGSSPFTGIQSSAQPGSSRRAGSVRVVAGVLEILAGGAIESATFGEGDAGAVTVEADRMLIRGGGSELFTGISSSAGTSAAGEVGQGDAGRVRIEAATIEIADGGDVSSSADGPGTAGDVIIAADRLVLDGGTISTDSAAAGGGEIQVLVGDVIDLRNSAVTTSVAGGADPTAGNITIDPTILIIDGSVIRADANAPRGFGGNVRIEADNILVAGGDFEALVDRGDISASGGDPSRAGRIVVHAPDVDLSAGLVVVEGGFVDTAQLRERCASRRDIGASSFTRLGRAGLPPSPDTPLAGGYLAAGAGLAGTGVPLARLAASAPATLAAARPPVGSALPCAPRS